VGSAVSTNGGWYAPGGEWAEAEPTADLTACPTAESTADANHDATADHTADRSESDPVGVSTNGVTPGTSPDDPT
jgi:hypothetical protein